MPIDFINPDTLPKPRGYSQVAVATGRRIAYISGQVGVGADGKVVGEDAAAQTTQALANLGACLDAIGAAWTNVARIAIYVVNLGPENGRAVGQACAAFLPAENPPAGVVLGIQALARPEFLVEIEAVAVLD